MDVFQGAWTLVFVPVLLVSLWALCGPGHTINQRWAALPVVIISGMGCWYGRPATWAQDFWATGNDGATGFGETLYYVFVEKFSTWVWALCLIYVFGWVLWYVFRRNREGREPRVRQDRLRGVGSRLRSILPTLPTRRRTRFADDPAPRTVGGTEWHEPDAAPEEPPHPRDVDWPSAR